MGGIQKKSAIVSPYHNNSNDKKQQQARKSTKLMGWVGCQPVLDKRREAGGTKCHQLMSEEGKGGWWTIWGNLWESTLALEHNRQTHGSGNIEINVSVWILTSLKSQKTPICMKNMCDKKYVGAAKQEFGRQFWVSPRVTSGSHTFPD